MSKAYLVSYDKGYKNPLVETFSTKSEAGEASFKCNRDGKVMLSSEDDLNNLGGPELVALYNMLNGADVNKFRDLKTGAQRVFTSVKAISESNDPAINPQAAAQPAPKAAKVKKEKAPKAEGAKTYDKIDSAKKIVVLVETNPRRAGTAGHKSFALIEPGMTVGTFIERGGRRVDLKWDLKKNYVKLED